MSLLQVKNLSKTYQYDDYAVLVDISFAVDAGEAVTLLMGQNGGKTTLAKILTGLEEKSTGEIIYRGAPIEETSLKDRNVAFISVPSLYIKGKVKDNVAYGLRVRGVDKKTALKQSHDALTCYGLESLADKKVKTLTTCQRAKLDFARAFSRKVSLLILDCCFGKCEETDDFLYNEITKKLSEKVAVLILTDDKKHAIGKTYDFLPVFEKEN